MNTFTMNTQINKCENACNTDYLNCEYIGKYYTCSHYCCYRTTLILNRCIACGNINRSKFKPDKPKRCRCCRLLPCPVSKVCNDCEDDLMFAEDFYGYEDDTEEMTIWRNRNKQNKK